MYFFFLPWMDCLIFSLVGGENIKQTRVLHHAHCMSAADGEWETSLHYLHCPLCLTRSARGSGSFGSARAILFVDSPPPQCLLSSDILLPVLGHWQKWGRQQKRILEPLLLNLPSCLDACPFALLTFSHQSSSQRLALFAWCLPSSLFRSECSVPIKLNAFIAPVQTHRIQCN